MIRRWLGGAVVMACVAGGCGGDDAAPVVTGDAGAAGGAGDPGGAQALAPSPLTLTTKPAAHNGEAAADLDVQVTIENTGDVEVPISLDKFFVNIGHGVLLPGGIPDFREGLARCPISFTLLPGGTISCVVAFVTNLDVVGELRYDDGTSLPATVAVSERPEYPGCRAAELASFGCVNSLLRNVRDFGSCAAFLVCEQNCAQNDRVSGCTCVQECLPSSTACPWFGQELAQFNTCVQD